MESPSAVEDGPEGSQVRDALVWAGVGPLEMREGYYELMSTEPPRHIWWHHFGA